MAEIKFNSGAEKHTIFSSTGHADVYFGTTDIFFGERIYKAFDELAKISDEFSAKSDPRDPLEMFENYHKLENDLRAVIDGLLGDGTSEALWGCGSCFATSDGLPGWVNLMFALIDSMTDSAIDQQKLTSPRISKYAEKYKQYNAQYKK